MADKSISESRPNCLNTRADGLLSRAQNYMNTAVADVEDQVIESDETNNETTDSYTVS